jgi:hypothetical protein
MAFAVLRNATGDTTDGSIVTSSAFTPGVGELLVVFASLTAASSDSIRPAMTGSNGMSFSRQGTFVYWGATTANFIGAYVATGLVTSAVSMTVSINWGANTATGASFVVAGIQGMQKVGGSVGQLGSGVGQGAVVQSWGNTNTAAAVPQYASALASDANNLVMCCVGSLDNPPAVTAPTGFVAFSSTGYATPTAGLQVVQRQYGGAPAALAWGGLSSGTYGSVMVELACDNLDSTDCPQFVAGSGI